MDKKTRAEVDRYILTHLGEKGSSQVDIVERIGNMHLYHISTNAHLKGFVPKISNKRYPGEDVQIPRASFGPSLIECILGYGGFYNVYVSEPKWDGIYRIYEPEWEVAFKPNMKLMPDVKWTNEHWLLFFKPEMYNTPCKKTGEFFVRSFNSVLKKDKEDTEVTLFLRCLTDNVSFINGYPLMKGFYQIVLQSFKCPNYEFRLNENVFIDKVTEKEYRWAYAIRTNNVK